MKKPVQLLLTSLFLSSSVFTSGAEATLNLQVMPRGAHVDINKLIEQMPVKDMSELPPHGLSLKHQAPHPFGVIYHGVRYVEGHAKKLANDHHVENKLTWFKGLVDHVRMTATQKAHYNIHEGYPILKVSVDHLKERLDGMVQNAPPEARAPLHEKGWKMIHDLINELRGDSKKTDIQKLRSDHLDSELKELGKLNALIKGTKPSDLELTGRLQKMACDLHNEGMSLARIHEAAPHAFSGSDDEQLIKDVKENPDAAIKAIKDGKHRTTKHARDVVDICKKLAPRNGVIPASVTQ